MAFFETRFPVNITFGSTGGPMFSTVITPLDSGAEKRNIQWPIGRHRYDAAGGIHTASDYQRVIDMFMACRGRGHGFRWKDWLDYKTADTVGFEDCELIDASGEAAVGDDSTTEFYLAKKYTFGTETVYRPITKPVSGTVSIGLAGVEQTLTTHFTVDTTTGAITFVTAPTLGQVLTGGCEFDVPCRFDADELPARIADRTATEFLIDFDIPVIEIKPA